MNNTDLKILHRACGLSWNYGDSFDCKDDGSPLWNNHTFDSAADWELVRVKVVQTHLNECIDYMDKRTSLADPPELLCQAACNFIKSRPDLFPWVIDFAAEIAKNATQPTESTQIASGKRMPGEGKK